MKFIVLALLIPSGYSQDCLQGSNLESKWVEAASACGEPMPAGGRNAGSCDQIIAALDSLFPAATGTFSDDYCSAAVEAAHQHDFFMICEVYVGLSNSAIAVGRQDNAVSSCVDYLNSQFMAGGRSGLISQFSQKLMATGRNGGICDEIKATLDSYFPAAGRNSDDYCSAAINAAYQGDYSMVCTVYASYNSMNLAAGRQSNAVSDCMDFFNSQTVMAGGRFGLISQLLQQLFAGQTATGRLLDHLSTSLRNGCESFESIMDYVETAYSEPACYLSSFGWYNAEDMTFNNNVIKEDLMTLPTEVTANITKESVKACVKGQVANMLTDNDCFATYTLEEKKQLRKVVRAVAKFECLQSQVHDGCTAYMGLTAGGRK